MSKLNEVALQVSNVLVAEIRESDDTFSFDPSIIFVIIDIIKELLPVIIDCFDGDDENEGVFVTQTCNDPSIFQRIGLRLRLRNMMGGRNFRKYGKEMSNALLKIGSQVTSEDVKALLQEV